VGAPAGAERFGATLYERDAKVRVLVISTMVYPEVAERLEIDKVLVDSAPPGTADRLAFAFPGEAARGRVSLAIVSQLQRVSHNRLDRCPDIAATSTRQGFSWCV
jgi:hypothetical protein